MTIKKFARIALRIQTALQAGAQTVTSLKATVPATPLKPFWSLSAEGDGWIIYTFFGRRLLFRAEVRWDDDEPRSRVSAYLEEPNEDRGNYTWVPLDVVVENGEVPMGDDGETISPEWYLLESALAALYSRNVVFRPEVPNRSH